MNQTVKPKVLLLGTFHMGSTTDLYKPKVDDLLSSERQQEILEVVERLKKFKPSKIALEIETKRNDKINQQYQQYRLGSFELKVNEVHQLGYRIASDLEHEQVYCIDWMEKGAGTKGFGDVYMWAKEHQPELFKFIFGWLDNAFGNDQISNQNILEMYRIFNEPSHIKKHHTMNINVARIGEMENYVGMEWLIWWYQRNLILFSNLARIATSTEDRIVLIIGAGHVQILSQFLNESDLFDLEDAYGYLI
ncbi:DUF5694 domain-containing protein [Paenibacillus sp.]|jgi:hypothetical protein|uniref:DUF5694 domain-containing protein n=1 Tax=Paenibacillus sp. TaxID=58172 RepID=UPI002831C941|nr:DUF5694 domain-containing protein [Paenibacillus sp.]MDR0269493.1 DUF5694 domain-containing protein [Paenibacillus sp.]